MTIEIPIYIFSALKILGWITLGIVIGGAVGIWLFIKYTINESTGNWFGW